MSKDWIWVEKYRPKKLGEFIGNPDLKDIFRKWTEDGECQHSLLWGPPGTGKTSAARILIEEIGAASMELNASDESGIDIIRDKVKRYASLQTHGRLKIILLDEADRLTIDSQWALRRIIEKFSKGTRFILTCNHPNKIEDALKSRCFPIKMAAMPRRDMMIRLGYILKSEGIKDFDVHELDRLTKLYYPDMRRIINALQFYSRDGVLSIDFGQIRNDDYRLKVLDLLKKKKWREIRKVFASEPIDETEVYTFLFNSLDDPRAMLIVAEYMWRDSCVADREINLMACCLEVMEIITQE